MRGSPLLTSALLVGLCAPAGAAVEVMPGTEFATSGWNGAAIYDDSGTQFRACYMLRDFDGIGLLFALNREGLLSIGFRNDSWFFGEDFEVPLRIQMDDWVDVEVTATAETPHALFVAAGTGSDVMEALRQGHVLSVFGDIGGYQLPLTGTTNALPALADCVASVPEAPGKPPLTAEEKEVVRALALYPGNVREAILEATLRPDLIAALNDIATQSRQDFRALVGDLPRDSQALVWEVVRYPAMLDSLVALGPSPSEDAVRAAIATQPADAQESLLLLMAQEPDLAEQAHDVRLQAEQRTSDLLSREPLQVESAFRIVLEQPEALSKMSERPDLVARIAEVYRRDPALVLSRLEEIAQEIDANYEASVQAWAQQLEANPAAAEELVEASRLYAEENGLPPPAQEASDPTTEVSVDDAIVAAAPGEGVEGEELVPYPYYYGPPPGQEAYYPYQPQDSAGFYLNELGELVVVSLMTYAFVDWLFDDDDDYWDRYPDLSSEVIINVDRTNIWIGGGNDRVRDWVDDNRHDLPDGWFDNDGDLRDRMGDYADAHRDFEDWRDKNGGKGSLDDFVKDRGDRFPGLADQVGKFEGKDGGRKQLDQIAGTLGDKGGGKLKDTAKGKSLLDGFKGNDKKATLGSGGLLAKDNSGGGFVKKGGEKSKVKLKKKDKTEKKNTKKKNREQTWKGEGKKKKRK